MKVSRQRVEGDREARNAGLYRPASPRCASATHSRRDRDKEVKSRACSSPAGWRSLYVGSPETVARKIVATVRAPGASRFDLKYSAGKLGHELLLRSIEVYGSDVIPRVRELLTEAAPVRAEGEVAASGR